MGKRLPALDAKTTPADGDLLYIDSGNHDYQMTIGNLLTSERSRLTALEDGMMIAFATDESLTTQVDALPVQRKVYFGGISGYNHQEATGVPVNNNFYVKAQKYTDSYAYIEIWSINGAQEGHFIITKNNGTWGSWEKVPTRSEITRTSHSYTANQDVSITRFTCYDVAGIFIANGVFVLSSAFTTGSSLFRISSLSLHNTTDFLTYVNASGTQKIVPHYVDTDGWVHCNAAAPAGTYFFNLSGALV